MGCIQQMQTWLGKETSTSLEKEIFLRDKHLSGGMTLSQLIYHTCFWGLNNENHESLFKLILDTPEYQNRGILYY